MRIAVIAALLSAALASPAAAQDSPFGPRSPFGGPPAATTAPVSGLEVVDVSTASDDGQASAHGTATVLLTTDGDGGVSDVEGYSSTSPVRESGPN